MAPNNIPVVERLQGLVVGAALGDALGLPSEGLTRQRIARLWPGPLTHRFIAGRAWAVMIPSTSSSPPWPF
ncbi:ADP-ribosylglycohydrolase family protein [Verrucomicrobium spinosum]|uniref:ADP-ribosylglycohydrolase family protein n=1 Tax=Verrucomicrobium spinosum TaxID=2736 RepID=UPI0012E3153B